MILNISQKGKKGRKTVIRIISKNICHPQKKKYLKDVFCLILKCKCCNISGNYPVIYSNILNRVKYMPVPKVRVRY